MAAVIDFSEALARRRRVLQQMGEIVEGTGGMIQTQELLSAVLPIDGFRHEPTLVLATSRSSAGTVLILSDANRVVCRDVALGDVAAQGSSYRAVVMSGADQFFGANAAHFDQLVLLGVAAHGPLTAIRAIARMLDGEEAQVALARAVETSDAIAQAHQRFVSYAVEVARGR